MRNGGLSESKMHFLRFHLFAASRLAILNTSHTYSSLVGFDLHKQQNTMFDTTRGFQRDMN